MKKNVIELILLLLVLQYLEFVLLYNDTRLKLDEFNNLIIQEGLNYKVNNEVYVVYDFSYLNNVASELFGDEKVTIIKKNETCFDIEVIVGEGVFKKVVLERYQIVKGDIL